MFGAVGWHDGALLIEPFSVLNRCAPDVSGPWLLTASILDDFYPAVLVWPGVGALVTSFRLIPLWGLSGTSLLLSALNVPGALVGLLAFSSPRQARPEPRPAVRVWGGSMRPHNCFCIDALLLTPPRAQRYKDGHLSAMVAEKGHV
jgi:hypothetical protein